MVKVWMEIWFKYCLSACCTQGSTEANSLAMKHHAELSGVEKNWQDKFEVARKVGLKCADFISFFLFCQFGTYQ